MKTVKLMTLGIPFLLALPSVAQQMPQQQEIDAAMQAARQMMPGSAAIDAAMHVPGQRAADALGQAQNQSQPNAVFPQRIVPPFAQNINAGVDPAAIAEQYKNLGRKPSNSDAPELMIFVSLSMPETSLKLLGQQAKQAGAVVVFRGLKYGLRKGTYTQSMQALKPIVGTGADVQIHPELFGRYHVTAVPTLVVSAAPQSGCQDDACAAQSAAVMGDVSLDYALERLTSRTDAIGNIARERLKLLRND
jgi:conjugal transfer pilus assembly protein TrbC